MLTHELLMSLAFGICMLVGATLSMMSMTTLGREGERAEGMLVMATCMAMLFLFGYAGYMRLLP